jgi:hypothetical protein
VMACRSRAVSTSTARLAVCREGLTRGRRGGGGAPKEGCARRAQSDVSACRGVVYSNAAAVWLAAAATAATAAATAAATTAATAAATAATAAATAAAGVAASPSRDNGVGGVECRVSLSSSSAVCRLPSVRPCPVVVVRREPRPGLEDSPLRSLARSRARACSFSFLPHPLAGERANLRG